MASVNFTDKSGANYVWPVRSRLSGVLGSLALSPAATTFATTITGTMSTPVSFSLINASPSAVTVSGITITGTDISQFSVAPGGILPCSSLTPSLASGASCSINVTFAPTSTGAKNATLHVTSNAPGATTLDAIFSGTAAAVPGTPTIGDATAGNTQASVTFTAPTSNGSSAITSYTVTANPGGITATGTGSPIAVSGLTNGTAYTFTVTATNATGTSTASNASNSVTPMTVPSAPIFGAITAGNAQATVTFMAPTSTGGSDITGYLVTSNPEGGVDTNAGSTATTHTITGLTNGKAYTFTVVAANGAGLGAISPPSNTVTPQATVPGAPTGVTAVPGNVQATVTFTAPASNGGSTITGYTVTSTPAGGVDGNAGTTSMSHTITGLTNGTAYTFTVVATNVKGNSAVSAASNSVTPNILSPVIGAPSVAIAKSGATVTYTVTYSGASAITLANSDVTINKTNSAFGTAIVSGTGTSTRTVTISGITGDGTLGLSIGANTANNGAISASASAASSTFVVDNTAPALSTTALATNTVTSNSTFNIAGTATDTNGIQNVTVNGNTVTLTNGAFTTAVTLTNGTNAITTVATDMAGNQTTDSRTITFDTSVPVITLSAPTPADQSYTNLQTVILSGTVSKPGTVIVTVNTNSPITVNTTGAQNNFTMQIPLAAGANTINILANDSDTPPLSATILRTIVYDTVAPILAIVDPATAITTTFNNYLVTGTTSDNNSGVTLLVSVNGAQVTAAPTVSANGSFQQNISFATAQTYTVSVTATDKAGNQTIVQRNIVYQPYTIADALRALQIASKITTATIADLKKLDIGPLTNDKPAPDGQINLSDAILLLRLVVGDLNGITW